MPRSQPDRITVNARCIDGIDGPTLGSQEIKIERRGDTYRAPVRINQTITLPFLLDTGASDLVIPADVDAHANPSRRTEQR